MKERYIKTYGNAYELLSPDTEKLEALLHQLCKENGILSNPDDCFKYMNELPEKYTQMSIFDLPSADLEFSVGNPSGKN